MKTHDLAYGTPEENTGAEVPPHDEGLDAREELGPYEKMTGCEES